jgi:cell division protein FtsB
MFHIESIKREIAASQSTYFVVDRGNLESLVAEVERLRKEDEENINKISELQERNDQLVEENITLRNTNAARPAATVRKRILE